MKLILLSAISLFAFTEISAQLAGSTTSGDTFLGTGAGGPSGGENTGIGYLALDVNTGNANAAVGHYALRYNTSGSKNAAIGTQALEKNQTGEDNIAIGFRTMYNSTVGSRNVAIGSLAYTTSFAGSGNVILGYNAAAAGSIPNGNNNIFLGSGTSLGGSSSSNNVIIGCGMNFSTGFSNRIIIGDGMGTVRLLFDENGNGGVGTMTPKNKFDVGGSLAVGTGYSGVVTAPVNGAIIQGNVGIGKVTPGNKLEIQKESNTNITGNSGLRFTNLNSTFNPSTTNTKFLTVNGSGDVILQNLPPNSGGGTTINAGTNILVSGNPTTGYTISANPALTLVGNVLSISGGNSVTLPSASSTDDNTNIYNTDGELESDRIVHMDGNDLIFDSTSGSKVYIGDAATTSAANFSGNYKLYVEDGIMTEKVKVAITGSTDWADYVFNDDYKLMPINEVADYVKQHKHLPGVPSSEELIASGMDLAKMQAKQMEKIEELTLYIIGQQEKIKSQQDEIDLLKNQQLEITALKAQMTRLLESKH